jgi:hypothetical protein
MKQVIKLTNTENKTILIGVDSIISVKLMKKSNFEIFHTQIESRGAMISTNYVKESVEEIYNLINN